MSNMTAEDSGTNNDNEKPRMAVAAFGPAKSGKSTLLGHFMYQCGAVGLDVIERYEREAADAAKGKVVVAGQKYAWIFDTLDVERERGMSVDITLWKCQSEQYSFTVIDTPGHENYMKNMITGIAQADIGILVLSAKSYAASAAGAAGLISGIDLLDAQSREHLLLAYSLGVKQLVVVVNQMDLIVATEQQQEEIFLWIRRIVSDFLRKVGYKPMKVTFIPTNALTGDNLVVPSSSSSMSWYDGPTILQALNKCTLPKRQVLQPFRMPIQDVFKIGGVGTVVVGRIATGQITRGTKITIAPCGLVGIVKNIEIHHEPVDKAVAGDNVGLNLQGIAARVVKRGHVLSIASGGGNNDHEYSATAVESFMAQVIFMENHHHHHSGKVTVGYRPMMDCHTAHVSCEFMRIVAKMDRRTGEILEENPSCVYSGEACIVELKPLTPLSLEAFADFPSLGRFVVRGDDKHLVAVGVVNSIIRAAAAAATRPDDDDDESSDDDSDSDE